MLYKKILIITGSYPPDVCGVGDYVKNLTNNSLSDNFSLYYNNDWNIRNLFRIIKEINALKHYFLNLQYPTQGYGWSLIPLFLTIYYSFFTSKKLILTVHELSQRTFKSRIITILMIFFSSKIIFTNEFEKKYALKIIPFIKNKVHVIKICSNIASAKVLKKYSERTYDLIYFGHIRPNKGIEEFIECANSISRNSKFKIAIVGQILPIFEKYYEQLKSKNKYLNIEFIINNDENRVIDILNSSKIVYLPFPDGISERRGSFLASIANGALVLTTNGKFTTKELENTCYFTTISKASEAVVRILTVFNDEEFSIIQDNNKNFLLTAIPDSWESVAKSYLKLIDK